MSAVLLEQDHRTMSPHEYLSDLNKTAMCALAMGAPLGLVRHVTFLLNYINAWLDQVKDSAKRRRRRPGPSSTGRPCGFSGGSAGCSGRGGCHGTCCWPGCSSRWCSN